MPEFLTREEACNLLRCRLSSLDRNEEIPRYKLKRKVLFRRTDLEAYLDAHKVMPSSK